MGELTNFAGRLGQECPTLDVQVSRNELAIDSGGARVRLRGDQISKLDARERRRRRREGTSYLDLGTGSLYVDEPGLFLYLRLPPSARSRLTPYQCALLAAILDDGGSEWFVSGIAGPQVDLIRRVKLELGVEVPPMAMSRFLDALRRKGVLRSHRKASWKRAKAFDSLRDDFRLSAVGRADTYAGDYLEVEKEFAEQLGGRLARGVADALTRQTGAWIEPRDYLVERGALSTIQELLGGPVPRGYEGTVVTVRPALRVPLRLLTLGTDSLHPILGIAEALRMDSPVAREAGREAWERWEREWK